MDRIIVLDFGGQYCHLISRRIKDLGVYSEVLPAKTTADELRKTKGLMGIILSGGAASVYDETSPKCDSAIFDLGIPILGICYGHQLIAYSRNGEVVLGEHGEYGITNMKILKKSRLLAGLKRSEKVWMNHRDIVKKLPEGYDVVASTTDSPIAAFENNKLRIYGVQFHPEVTHTEKGDNVFKNFAFGVCKAAKGWSIKNFIRVVENEIREKIGRRKAIVGLSGGVDSSTAAILVSKVIGKNLTAVYVDTGLMRAGETDFIRSAFSKYPINLRIVDAKQRFFEALKGVEEPEQKRKVIGKLFIDVFNEIATQQNAEVLIQGTIYSDRIESGVTEHSEKIKSHHNVGGLPEQMMLEIYEPLRDIYKDEVRQIAGKLHLPKEIITRHVFPGPGLAVRIIGEVTPEKTEIVRKASLIIDEELKRAKLYEKVWMGFAVLLSIKSVGIQGDSRTYKYPIVVRIIESKDAMTANFAKIPYGVLSRISTRITNEIMQVNRVVYDISNKPPATMEWE